MGMSINIGKKISLLMDPYFRRFFGLEDMTSPRSRIERGQGSGVIFSATCPSINIAGMQFSGINILTDNNNYKLSYSLLNSDFNKCQIEGKYQSYKDYMEFGINNESFIY